MITDVVLTIAVVSFICCLSFFTVLFLLPSDMDYKTKNSHSIMVLGVIVFTLFLYFGYLLFGV